MDWAHSGHVTLARAGEHFAQLHREIRAWLESKAVRIEAERDANEYRLVARVDAPGNYDRWGAITHDCFHNLRLSLNHLWFLAAYPRAARRAARGRTRDTDFPILPDAQSFQARFGGVVPSLPELAVRLLRQVEPYRGGDDLVWLIQELDNKGKHQMLTPTGLAIDLAPDVAYTTPFMGLRQPSAVPGPIHDGTVIYRIPAGEFGLRDPRPMIKRDVEFEVDGWKQPRLLHHADHAVQTVRGIVNLFIDAGAIIAPREELPELVRSDRER